MCTTLARRCSRSVHGCGHVLCTCTGRERGRLCKRSEAKAEAEAKAETDAKAEAKVIVTRPRLAVFVYNSGSTDLLGQRDLLRSFETANCLNLEVAGFDPWPFCCHATTLWTRPLFTRQYKLIPASDGDALKLGM